MSGRAVIELRDVIRVWIEFRAPKLGELMWSVPKDATPEEALEHVVCGRDTWETGEGGFGFRNPCNGTPEFDTDGRNIVVHVDYVRSEPSLNNVIPHIKLL
jgi:hypothetical protein